MTTLRHVGAAVTMLGICAAVGTSTACSDPGGIPPLRVDSMVISSLGVTPAEARTYEYDFADVQPDSVLEALWHQGFDPEVAWRPLHYMCEDPRGGRLTVQLAAPDSAMALHDFSPGTGRLECSPDLMRYVLSPGSD